jgi:endonuclease/exonuclease/phosphatase family metal-dependent hydrolase
MTKQSPTHPSRFQRFANITAGLYLLSILIYLLLRFTLQDDLWWLGLVNSFAYLIFLPLAFLLVLALLARSRRAFLSLLPVIFLLLLWFGPRFIPKNVAPDGTILRVMTNNVWRLNPTPEAVTDLITIAKPDIIFLQEVQLSTQADALAPLNTEYPYQSSLIDEIRIHLYTAANITLSRYPFVLSEKIDLNLANMPAIYRDVIEVEGQRIALYNVHLITPFSENPRLPIGDNYFAKVALGYDDEPRNQQLATLLAYLKSEPYPYIAAGDFNLSDLSMTYGSINGQMRDSFSEVGSGLGYSWPVAEALALPDFLPPLVRMDYIWHSGLQTLSAWQGEFVGSDHLPQFADFAVKQ